MFVDGIGRLNFKGDSLASQGLHCERPSESYSGLDNVDFKHTVF